MAACSMLAFVLACGAIPVSSSHVPAAAKTTPIPASGEGKGQPVQETDFPTAPQSLVFRGTISAEVSVGRPNACGSGSGPYGPVIFAYGLYFQAAGQWLAFNVTTDGRAYAGPSSYHTRAWLSAVGPEGQQPIGYKGDINLVVTKDTMPAAGTVNGQLLDDAGHVETVSGGWTCVFGPSLGPG